MLTWSWATDADADDFAQVTCTEGVSAQPWVREAEDYVRGWVLRRAQHVLAHRDEGGAIVAVSAFDQTVIGIPLLSPLDHPGWHIVVVAISLEHQNMGLSSEVFAGTFDAMRQIDANRVFITANVHRGHFMSQRACAKAGLTPWIPLDDEYWILLGELPGSLTSS